MAEEAILQSVSTPTIPLPSARPLRTSSTSRERLQESHSPSPSSSPTSDAVYHECIGSSDQKEQVHQHARPNDADGSGWSNWSSAGTKGASSYTPPSSYTPSLPLSSSREPGKGKGREHDPEEGAEGSGIAGGALVQNPAALQDGFEQLWGDQERWGHAAEADPSAISASAETDSAQEEAAEHSASADVLQGLTISSAQSQSTSNSDSSLPASPPASPASLAPTPKRSRTLSFPRAMRRSTQLTTTSAPTTTKTPPATPPRRFARSLTSLSTTSVPRSSSSLPLSRTASGDKDSTTVSGGRKKMIKALSYIKSSGVSKEKHHRPFVVGTSSPPSPARLRSRSAPLLPTLTIPSSSSFAPDSPFITAPSTPITEDLVNLFDTLLPREVRLRIMGMLLQICVEEHEKEVERGEWKGARGRERWVGEVKGKRELVRTSRVSRTWLSLALDGQNWSSIPTSLLGADVLRTPALLRLVGQAGTFVRDLDLRGMRWLQGETLVEITELAADAERGTTNFTRLDLTDCVSLTTSSLDYLLAHSPHLRDVILLGLDCVVASTITTLGSTALNLRSLNVNRCRYLAAPALLDLAEVEGLEELRVAGLSTLTDLILFTLIQHHGSTLRILDASAGRVLLGLSSTEFGPLGLAGTLSSRFPGFTLSNLRLLNISSNRLLSDDALSHLRARLPSLTHLLLAHPGPLFHPPGLIALLSTAPQPQLTHLDLEHAVQMDDSIIPHLPETLEVLILSSCVEITAQGWGEIVRRCGRLKALEADGTSMDEGFAREFVRLRAARAVEEAQGQAAGAGSAPSGALSLLDSRVITRGLEPSLAGLVRPRMGQRGYWTTPLAYHDGEDEAGQVNRRGVLEECDESKVVVRSFYGHASIDGADKRRAKAVAKAKGGSRRRASDGAERGERGRSCIVS